MRNLRTLNNTPLIDLGISKNNIPKPTGTLEITENGENIDVSNYAAVDVAISGGDSVVSNVATIGFASDLTQLDLVQDGHVTTLGNVDFQPYGYSFYADPTCTKTMLELTADDAELGLIFYDGLVLVRDGKKAYIGTANYLPVIDSYVSGTTYDVDAVLVTPTAVGVDQDGYPVVTTYTTTPYTGVKYHIPPDVEGAGPSYFTVVVDDIPSPAAVSIYSTLQNPRVFYPSIVIKGHYNN